MIAMTPPEIIMNFLQELPLTIREGIRARVLNAVFDVNVFPEIDAAEEIKRGFQSAELHSAKAILACGFIDYLLSFDESAPLHRLHTDEASKKWFHLRSGVLSASALRAFEKSQLRIAISQSLR